MSEAEKIACSACGRLVDPHARVCPYCAADPHSGQRVSSRPEIEELIPRRPVESTTEKVLTTIRSRSGVVLTISITLGVVLLLIASNWVDQRQRTTAANVPSIPLTEITDLSATTEDERELELPDLEFGFYGNPSTMETFVLEQGAEQPAEEKTNEENEENDE